MKQKCQACGVMKDSLVKEIYPYPQMTASLTISR